MQVSLKKYYGNEIRGRSWACLSFKIEDYIQIISEYRCTLGADALAIFEKRIQIKNSPTSGFAETLYKGADNDVPGTSRSVQRQRVIYARASNGRVSGEFELQLPARFGRDKAARLHVTHHRESMHETIMERLHGAQASYRRFRAARSVCLSLTMCRFVTTVSTRSRKYPPIRDLFWGGAREPSHREIYA